MDFETFINKYSFVNSKFVKDFYNIIKEIQKMKITLRIKKQNFFEKMILNKRILVEHAVNRYKQFKRLNNRYDKKVKTLKLFYS